MTNQQRNLPDEDAAPPEASDSSIHVMALALALIALLVYLGWPSSCFNGDGVVFSFWVESGHYSGETGKLWHPRHLAYCPMGYVLFKAVTAAGIGLRAIHLFQLLDSLFAAATLYLFHVFCARLTHDRVVSIVATIFVAFSYGHWYFAVEPEVYSPNVFCLMLGVYAAWRWSSPESKLPWWLRAAGLGVIGALAMANHITSGLLLIVLGWATLWGMRGHDDPSIVKRMVAGVAPSLVMAATAFGLVGALYYVGYRDNPLAQGQGFLPWVTGEYNAATGLGYDKSYWMITPGAILVWLGGTFRCFVAGGVFLQNDYPWLMPLRVFATGGLLAGVGLYLWQLNRVVFEHHSAKILIVLAILPMLLFSMAWEPRGIELKTSILPFVWLIAAQGMAVARQRLEGSVRSAIIWAWAFMALCMFAHNFAGSILPGSDPANNRDLTRAHFVREHAEEGAVVYVIGLEGDFGKAKYYLPYFSLRQARVVDWVLSQQGGKFPQALNRAFAGDRQRPVYVLSELLEDGPALEALGQKHRIAKGRLIEWFLRRSPELVARMDDGFAIYRLR